MSCAQPGATSESEVVGRVAEWFVPGQARAWVPIEPEDISEGLVEVLSRFRLTVRDPRDPAVVYDVLVSLECFEPLRVGDAWPAPLAACR